MCQKNHQRLGSYNAVSLNFLIPLFFSSTPDFMTFDFLLLHVVLVFIIVMFSPITKTPKNPWFSLFISHSAWHLQVSKYLIN